PQSLQSDVVDQLIESREKAEAIERLFGDLEEQQR
ncbi:unnamed protein product, partial [marine sediment metagenome]